MLKVKPSFVSLGKDELGREHFACYCSNCYTVIFKHTDHCQYCGCEIEWGNFDHVERGDDLIDKTAVDDSREQGTD